MSISLLSHVPFLTHPPPEPSKILTLPTELILEIGHYLDIASLINLTKLHPLFASILDDPETSLIKSASSYILHFRRIPRHHLPPRELHRYHTHYTSPQRFILLDRLLAAKILCSHEINLLNYLTELGAARDFEDAEARFGPSVKSVTRCSEMHRHYRDEPWMKGPSGTLGNELRVFENVETLLHLKMTESAIEKMAATYSYAAEIVEMVDYGGGGAGKVWLRQACCKGIRSWRQLMSAMKEEGERRCSGRLPLGGGR